MTTFMTETIPESQVTTTTDLAQTRPLSASLDYYKPTMSQLAWAKEPDAEVTFTFHNRGKQRILDYVDPTALQVRFNEIGTRGWTQPELENLARHTDSRGKQRFAPEYLQYLGEHALPPVAVRVDDVTDDIVIETTGAWPLVTFWETTVMSEVTEAYGDGYIEANGFDKEAVLAEGDRRLDGKIAVMREHPDMKVAEFGTRRRFALGWQQHVFERMLAECPDNIVGTSNVALAETTGTRPIGTFAHEMPMVYAALADARGEDIRGSHQQFLNDWHEQYGPDLSIALTDTFGTKFFFEDFTPDQAREWRGLRQDSGEAREFGRRAIEFYEQNGIDPATKQVMFTDGLTFPGAAELHREFHEAVIDGYGIGTQGTNDLGIPALNIVMKATRVHDARTGNSAGTVKLSDNAGKHTGSPEDIARYQQIFA